MFPRKERLPRDLFPSVQAAGRRLSSPNFSIVYSQIASGYAVIVAKKVAKLSVTRHTIKRRVLAILGALALPKSLIVFPRASAVPLSFKETKEELAALLSKIPTRGTQEENKV